MSHACAVAVILFACLLALANAQCTANTCSTCLQNPSGGCAWNPGTNGCFTLSSQPSLAGQAVQVAAYCAFSSCVTDYVSCITALSNPTGPGVCTCITNLVGCLATKCEAFGDKSSCEAFRTAYCTPWTSYGCTGTCPGISSTTTTSSGTTTKPASTVPASCTQLNGDCSFFGTCLDARVPCSLSTNVLAAGFCQANFSAGASSWSSAVRICLQKKLQSLLTGATPTCDKVIASIRDAHETCDTNPASGQSVCSLSASDRAALLNLGRSGQTADWDALRSALAECAATIYSEIVLGVAEALAVVESKQASIQEQIAAIMKITADRITLFFRASTKRASQTEIIVSVAGDNTTPANTATKDLQTAAQSGALNSTVTVTSAKQCNGQCSSDAIAKAVPVAVLVFAALTALLM